VFGRVVEGLSVAKRMESCGSKSGKTNRPVAILDCGQVGARARSVGRRGLSGGRRLGAT